MELTVQTDLTKISEGTIAFNATELAAELDLFLDKYQGLVVTDENIPEAKAARADVNKVRDGVNDAKKKAKAAFMAPYTRFEAQVKGLLEKCDKVSGSIDAGIKEYEDRVRSEKRNAILKMFREATEGIEQYVGFDDVFDPKWLLASAKQGEIKSTIEDYAARSRLNVEAIAKMATEPADRAALESEYRRSRNLATVMALSGEIAARKAAAAKEDQHDPAAEITKILQGGRDIPQAVREESLPLFSQTTTAETAPSSPSGVGMGNEMTCLTVRIWGKNDTVGKILQYITAMGATYEEVY